MQYVKIDAKRDAYGVDDIIHKTFTVGDLIGALEDFDEDTKVILSHDNGYTYGAITMRRINLESDGEDEEEYDEDDEYLADDDFDESLQESDHKCGESHESDCDDLEEQCIHCEDDIECDDDFGDHENSYDVDEAYSFRGLNDRFGGKTLAESLRPRVPIKTGKKRK